MPTIMSISRLDHTIHIRYKVRDDLKLHAQISDSLCPATRNLNAIFVCVDYLSKPTVRDH